MKRFILVIVLLPIFTVSPAYSQEDIDVPANMRAYADILRSHAENIRGYADLVRARAEFIRMIGEARLASARAELTLAQAAHEWEEVRKLRILVNQLNVEMRNLRRTENAERKRMQTIAGHIVTFNTLVHGRATHHTFRSMRYLFGRVIDAGTLTEAMTIAVEEVDAGTFITNRPTVTAEPFAGGNVGQLLRFMEERSLSLEPWTPAHIKLMEALAKIGSAAETQLDEIQTDLDAVRAGTFDLWGAGASKPPAAAPKPPAAAAVTPPSAPVPQSAFNPRASHEFCKAAKGGFKACIEDGNSTVFCQPADKGFADCRADGYAQTNCVAAKSGYKLCRDDGYANSRCLKADSGYQECRGDGFDHDTCVPAKSGYRACRDNGYQPHDCIAADKGYQDCIADGLNHAVCKQARGSYKDCRADGLLPSDCVAVGKGYAQCRSNSYPPDQCADADEGYKDCVGV